MINKLFKSDAFLLIISSAISQIILIITVPLISRLYSPTEFGIFTIFTNVATIIIPIINARYDLLIINAKSEDMANKLSQISFYISLIIIIILAPIGLVFSILYNAFFRELLILIILLVFVSLTNIFTSYLNLNRKYKLVSLINVTRSFFMVLIQIVFGFYHLGAIGLIIGFSASYLAGITIGYKEFKMHFKFNGNKQDLKDIFFENINQLKYSTPSLIINSFSFSIIVFVIGLIYTKHDVGIYGMALRVLAVPVVVAGLGLSKIFMQNANNVYNKDRSFRKLLIEYTLLLSFLGMSVYIPILLWGKQIIIILLGDQWGDASKLFLPLSILCFIRLIVSTVSLSSVVIGKQKLDLYFQILLLCSAVLSCLYAMLINLNFINFVFINSLAMVTCYLIFYSTLFYYSKEKGS
ncbi:lipopolysaccharide biosynthesis protein [Macrococcus equipercicus]|uniref:Oligosaccharide flippase family protein n=1 Tax=Macrococcus equipercicus TaxID=69967 RepID=A0A9Q9BW94_9STAP|nr:oligosaccharide flippase family protein [Macrococcus equipercicus]UTH13597.1 oligosaccharide flippase family protein [Macrococcus equipercicus]